MNIGILFALLSMVFAGVNDVIFKKYTAEERSRGMYIFGIGIVWTLMQVVSAILKGVQFNWSTSSFFYGGISGLLLVCSNILLLESLKEIDASLGSTIYRLNTIGVVFLSIAFLNENIYWTKLTGILLGIIAVTLLFHSSKNEEDVIKHNAFLWLAIMASLFRALYGVISKAGLMNHASPEIMLLLASSSWIFGGALYARFQEKRFKITKTKVTYSIFSGIAVFFIVNFLLIALQFGEASIIVPIANLSFLVALILSVITKMEKLNWFKIIAIFISLLSIFLLSR